MSTTVVPFPSSLGEVLASADAALTNPDVVRTRAHITVAQAEEAEEREAARLFFIRHFPEVAAFNGHDIEQPTRQVLEPEAAGHRPWCVPGECVEHRYSDGQAYTEHLGPESVMPTPQGMAGQGAMLSAQLYESSQYDGAAVSFTCAGEGVSLDASGTGRVIEGLTVFLEGLHFLQNQMMAEAPAPAGTCGGLGGTCVTDHSDPLFTAEEGRCQGPAVTMPDLYGGDFPTAELVQWSDETVPYVNVGQDTPELDLAGVDQLLSDLRQYTAHLAGLRSQMARLQGGAR